MYGRVGAEDFVARLGGPAPHTPALQAGRHPHKGKLYGPFENAAQDAGQKLAASGQVDVLDVVEGLVMEGPDRTAICGLVAAGAKRSGPRDRHRLWAVAWWVRFSRANLPVVPPVGYSPSKQARQRRSFGCSVAATIASVER